MDAAARFLVSGVVQGVFFRASTQAQARRLGLRGFTRNLADGRVEVLASGDDSAIDSLHAWLQRGPEQAHVERVLRSRADPVPGDDFVIR